MSYEASDVLCRVRQHMQARGALGRYARPMTLARGLGFTRAEVLLSLWLLRRDDLVGCRSDGRWYWNWEGGL